MKRSKRVVKKAKVVPAELKPAVTEKRGSEWEALMRKFSEDHKEECRAVSVDIPRANRDMKVFPTGSMYEGSWDVLGMSGYGTYHFPNGVIYEGDFEDGMFNGTGELRYPSGISVKGLWNKGTLDDPTLIFADGIRYTANNWDYCKMPDRRFSVEYDYGLMPAGNPILTAEEPPRDIPPGHYDTGDGFYDSKTKVVYSATDPYTIVRSPGQLEQEWIVKNCRSNVDEPLGTRTELYEEWPEPCENPAALARKASIASSFASGWKDSVTENEGVWRHFSFSGQAVPPPRLSNSTRSMDDIFGALQHKSRFQWDIAVVD